MSRVSSINVGSIKVSSLLDGELILPAEVLINLNDKDAETINSNADNMLSHANVNAYLIQKGDRNLLIDAGCRELFIFMRLHPRSVKRGRCYSPIKLQTFS